MERGFGLARSCARLAVLGIFSAGTWNACGRVFRVCSRPPNFTTSSISTAFGPAANMSSRDGTPDDDLLSYELGELPVLNFDAPTAPSKPSGSKDDSSKKDTLGVDSELKIERARAPRVKLDADRLLGPNGIPLLQKTAPEKLGKRLRREKGKEYNDARRILEFYQIWADGMFPKARFRDVIGLVEKEGRGRRLKVARREWVDEARGLKKAPEEVVRDLTDGKGAEGTEGAKEGEEKKKVLKAKEGNLFFSDDEDDNLYSRPTPKPTGAPRDGNGALFFSDDEEPQASSRPRPADDDFDMDDDLNALLAAESAPKPSQQPSSSAKPNRAVIDDDDDFDMDAMDAMMDAEGSRPSQPSKPSNYNPNEPDFEELDALLASEEAASRPSKPSQPSSSAKPAAKPVDEFGDDDMDMDELDALMEVEREATKKMEKKAEEKKVVGKETKPNVEDLIGGFSDDEDEEFDFS